MRTDLAGSTREEFVARRVVVTLIGHLSNSVAAGSERGEVGLRYPVRITDQLDHLPDLAWYPEGRLTEGAPDGPPELVVEVLSADGRVLDDVRRRADYARVGINELWLIDPEGPAALVLRREGAEFVVALDLDADGELTSPLLPGLAIRVGALVER